MIYHYFKNIFLIICITLSTTSPSVSIEFPEPVRENIEWCRIWIPNANQDELPRVLFIGDSITIGYYSDAEEQLKKDVYTGYYATSRSVCDPVFFDELKLVLKQYQYDIIHFNNGLHGWGYTEEEYKKGLEHFVDTLKEYAPDAKLVWAHSTPHNLDDSLEQLADQNQRIKERNEIADTIMKDNNIPINDLFDLCYGHTDLYSQDKVHFNQEGKTKQANQVVEYIKENLK